MNNNANNSAQKASKRTKRKFNIIDFIILVLIISLLSGVVYAVMSWSNIKNIWATKSVSLQYTVEFRGVDQEFINNIKRGDTVTDAVSKNQLGVVDNVSTEKYTVLNYSTVTDQKDSSATTSYVGVFSEYPDKHNVTVSITSNAEYKQGVGYTINGRRIAVGEAIEMRFPEFSGTGYCIICDFN